MSSVGLSELFLLFVIGLLILGPERLPRVASQIGRWVGRARRTANQLRYQLEREIAEAEREPPKAKPARANQPATEHIAGQKAVDPGGTGDSVAPAPKAAVETSPEPAVETAPEPVTIAAGETNQKTSSTPD